MPKISPYLNRRNLTAIFFVLAVLLLPVSGEEGQGNTVREQKERELRRIEQEIEMFGKFVGESLRKSPDEAARFQKILDSLLESRKNLQRELGITGQAGTKQVNALVNTAEFRQIKSAYDAARDLSDISDRSKFEIRTKELMAFLESSLTGLERKNIAGQWDRQFFVSEFQRFFRRQALLKGFEQEQVPGEDEIVTGFYKEIDFILEGLAALQRDYEYDVWFWELLKNRLADNFKNIKKVPFQKRLELLKITGEQYRDKLTQLMGVYYDYSVMVNRYHISETKLSDKSIRSMLIGILKEGGKDIVFYRDNKEWLSSALMKNAGIYEDDLLDSRSAEKSVLILGDNRQIQVPPQVVLTGWELEPGVSENLRQEIRRLIQDLSNDDYTVRETATESLIQIGLAAAPDLEAVLESNDAEAKMRARFILRTIKSDFLGTRRIVDEKMGCEFTLSGSPATLKLTCQRLKTNELVWSYPVPVDDPAALDVIYLLDKGSDNISIIVKMSTYTQSIFMSKQTGRVITIAKE